jgi:hypothetical protein
MYLPMGLNPLKPSGNYVLLISTVSHTSFCIYVFRIILSLNTDYFLKQR